MRLSWLANRFVLTFGGVALAAALWNLYVIFNDDGLIEGRVIGDSGDPVEGATVTLTERTLLVAQPRGSTKTDAEGRFVFRDHHLHRLFLEVAKDGVGRAGPFEFRLYFKGQNLFLDAPFQLPDEAAS